MKKNQQSDMPEPNANRDASIAELDRVEAQITKNITACDNITGKSEKQLTQAREAAATILADAERQVKAFLDAAETAHAANVERAVSKRQALNSPLKRRREFLRAEVRRTVASACSPLSGPTVGAAPCAPLSVPLVRESEVPQFATRYVRKGGRLFKILPGR